MNSYFAQRTKRLPSGCLIWTGYLDADGYGITSYKGRTIGAHRLAFMTLRGPIPSGYFVCHKCDVRACVEPSHLFTGTCRDNVQDAVVKGRMAKGERNGMSKLSDDERVEMRRLYVEGWTQDRLAEFFGVSQCRVSYTLRHTTPQRARAMRSKYHAS